MRCLVPPAQYPGTPGDARLRIREPSPTTQMVGPPCFVIDVVLAVDSLVQLYELLQQGRVDSVLPIAERLLQEVRTKGTSDFA